MASLASPGASPLGKERAQGHGPVEDAWRKQAMRAIAHVDLDAFYTQVEVKNNPALQGKPVAVVQYNPFGDLATHTPQHERIFNDSNGSLIAVSYEARKYGVKRNMQGHEARKLCPELQLVQVPTAHGKADLTHYRAAGSKVTDILARLAVCEKASIDECYLDVTAEAKRRLEQSGAVLATPPRPEQLHVCGQEGRSAADWYARPPEQWGEGERLLACGAAAVAELRQAVQQELGFSCSAGVAHCKILSKLASGMHKPAQQTLVCKASVPGLLKELPIGKLRQLGGKFGDSVTAQLGISTVGELAAQPKQALEAAFGEQHGQWLHELAHGIDADEVKQRTLPKSISCGKTFVAQHTLRDLKEVRRWLLELGKELEARVATDRAENAREPKLLTVHAGQASWAGISRSGALRRPTAEAIADDALALLKKWTAVTPNWQINSLSIGVSNFVSAPTGKSTIARFLKRPAEAAPAAEGEAGASCSAAAAAAAAEPLERPAKKAAAEAAAEPCAVSSRESQARQAAAGGAGPGSAPAGTDPEVWAALPPEIRRELMLADLGSRGASPRGRGAAPKPGRRRPPSAQAGSIGQFFGKR